MNDFLLFNLISISILILTIAFGYYFRFVYMVIFIKQNIFNFKMLDFQLFSPFLYLKNPYSANRLGTQSNGSDRAVSTKHCSETTIKRSTSEITQQPI